MSPASKKHPTVAHGDLRCPPCHRAATRGWHGTSSCTSGFDPFPRAFQVAGWMRKSLCFDSCVLGSRRQPERAHLAPGANSRSPPLRNDLPSPRPSLFIPRGHGWKGPARDPRATKEGDSRHEPWLASRATQGHGGEKNTCACKSPATATSRCR